jgi:hypothetical protein
MFEISEDFVAFALNIGPSVFKAMIKDLGGVFEASSACGISVPTLYRWMKERGEGGWAGYPKSLVSLDSFIEDLDHVDAVSFIGLLTSEEGLLEKWRNGDLNLSSKISLSQSEIMASMIDSGIPRTTARRWSENPPYPRSLSSLDCLSQEAYSQNWFERLSVSKKKNTSRETPMPKQALSCITREKVFPCLVKSKG